MTKLIRAQAPKGATHYHTATGKYLKDCESYVLEWNEDKTSWRASYMRNTRGCIFIGKSRVGDVLASFLLLIVFTSVMIVW